MSATINRYEIAQSYHSAQQSMEVVAYGDYVLHADHLASHAYDEGKERASFEASEPMPPSCDGFNGVYYFQECPRSGREKRHPYNEKWRIWKACAKSRAKAAGC